VIYDENGGMVTTNKWNLTTGVKAKLIIQKNREGIEKTIKKGTPIESAFFSSMRFGIKESFASKLVFKARKITLQ